MRKKYAKEKDMAAQSEAQTKEMFEQDSSILEHLMLRQKRKDEKLKRRLLSRRSKERQEQGHNILDGLEKDKAFLASHIIMFKEWQETQAQEKPKTKLTIGVGSYPRAISPMSPTSMSPTSLGKIEEIQREIEIAALEAADPDFGGGSILERFEQQASGPDNLPSPILTETDDAMILIDDIRKRLDELEVDRISSPPAVKRSVRRSYEKRMRKGAKRSVIADYFQDNPLRKTSRARSGNRLGGMPALRMHAGRQMHEALRNTEEPLPFQIPKEVEESSFSIEAICYPHKTLRSSKWNEAPKDVVEKNHLRADFPTQRASL